MLLGQTPTRVIISSEYIILSGGTSAKPMYLVVNNSNTNAISTGTGSGWVISENEFNILQWNIGTSTGTYVVPFGYSTLKYLPLTFNISTGGTGSSGVIKFSTYHTAALNSGADPSDVTNLNAFILPGNPTNTDDSYNIVDRFYIIDANTGYTTKPTAGNITFSYISGTGSTEVGSPNVLTESHLMAQRFNSTSSTWSDWFGKGCTDAISANVGTVQTGSVSPANLYRSWALWDNLTALPLVMSSTNILCGGTSIGSATVTAYGGIIPYTYSWSPSGGTNATASNLSAGTYTVSVTDNTGCSSTASVTITQSTSLAITIASQTNITCTGGTGSITANAATGGTSPYTYSWTPSGGTNLTASGLTAGAYTITVTDNAGCTATASATILQLILRDSIASFKKTCIGTNSGSATVGVKYGITPYTYSWSPSGGTSATASGLSAGTYSVTVTDNGGCTATASVVIGTDTISAYISSSVSSLCPGACATLTANITGGVSPFTYAWTPVAGASATDVVCPDVNTTYSVTVTDHYGCTANATIRAIVTFSVGHCIAFY